MKGTFFYFVLEIEYELSRWQFLAAGTLIRGYSIVLIDERVQIVDIIKSFLHNANFTNVFASLKGNKKFWVN